MPGLRVGVDAIAAGSGLEEGAGGARGYYEGLLPLLASDPRVAEVIVYVPAWLDAGARWRPPRSRLRRCTVPKKRPLRVAYEHVGLTLRATHDHLDVLFSPANYRPLAYRGVNVVGLQAIQHFMLDRSVGAFRSTYMKLAVPRSIRGADMTIAVSETLRNDAIRLWNLDPERVVAIPLGPQPWVAERISRHPAGDVEPYRLADGSPYVVCISRLYALKNHRRLIEAFARVANSQDIPHKLVIVGDDADVTASQLAAYASEQGIAERVVMLGRVSQQDVPRLYAGASAVAYVSLYETFGHPVLEAFVMGIPLLTSRAGATAEIAGSAALLVDPLEVDEIAEGLRRVLFDEALRAMLTRAGADRLRDFSWERYAKGAVDVMELAVASRSASSGAVSAPTAGHPASEICSGKEPPGP